MKKKLSARFKYEMARIVAIRPPVTLAFFVLFIFAGLWVANPGLQGDRTLFVYLGGIDTLAGLFFYFGSLFMLFMGGDAYGCGKQTAAFGNALIRLAFFDVLFLVSLTGMYFMLAVPAPGWLVLDRLLFLTFFYAAGLFLRTISKTRETAFIYCMFTWFFFVVTMPGMAGAGWHTGIPAVAAGFTLLLLPASFALCRRRRSPGTGSDLDWESKFHDNFRPGHMYFVLCKDPRHLDHLFDRYMEEPWVACVDTVTPDIFDTNVNPMHLTGYFSSLAGAPREKTIEYLNILGIDLTAPKKEQRKTLAHMNRTLIIQKILCAAAAAGNRETVVFKDFLKGQSRQTERRFLELVSRLNRADRTVVYLGTEIFSAALPFEDDIRIDNYKSFTIDPLAVNLR